MVDNQDEQIIAKIREIIPRLSQNSKDKLLTVAETMMMLHEAQKVEMPKSQGM